jgi:putative phosphoribosyl transferase
VDQFVCPLTPDDLYAIGAWYGDFSQTEDEEVRELLSESVITFREV